MVLEGQFGGYYTMEGEQIGMKYGRLMHYVERAEEAADKGDEAGVVLSLLQVKRGMLDHADDPSLHERVSDITKGIYREKCRQHLIEATAAANKGLAVEVDYQLRVAGQYAAGAGMDIGSKTKVIRRNGYGNAVPLILEEAERCGEGGGHSGEEELQSLLRMYCHLGKIKTLCGIAALEVPSKAAEIRRKAEAKDQARRYLSTAKIFSSNGLHKIAAGFRRVARCQVEAAGVEMQIEP